MSFLQERFSVLNKYIIEELTIYTRLNLCTNYL